MIKINLLPNRRSKKRDAAVRELTIGGAVIGIACAGLYVWFAVMGTKVTTAEKQMKATQDEIRRIEQDIVRVDDFKSRKQGLEKKLAVIDELKMKKTGPVRMLDELATNIPKRVYINSFDEKGGVLTLEGGAADNDELSDFLGYLTDRSQYFSGVTLAFSEVAKVAPSKGQSLPKDALGTQVKFKITGRASYITLLAPTGPVPGGK